MEKVVVKVASKQLQARFKELHEKKYSVGGEFSCDSPVVKDIKKLMVDLKAEGCFVGKHEWDSESSRYDVGKPSEYFYPPSHTMCWDFLYSKAHGEQWLRVLFNRYDEMEGALDSGAHQVDLIYTGNSEYWRWVD
jgi:hypothetical protein